MAIYDDIDDFDTESELNEDSIDYEDDDDYDDIGTGYAQYDDDDYENPDLDYDEE